MNQLKRCLPLLILLISCGLFYFTGLHHVFTLDNLKTHHANVLRLKNQHQTEFALCFMLTYTLIVASSIPIATLLTLVSGFLFGPLLGTLYVIFSATLGAVMAFCAYQSALREWVKQKMNRRLHQFEAGFKRNAFSNCLFLRLAPIFPFWTVNMAMALLGMNKRSYVISTIIGMVPCTALYVYVGSKLSELFHQNSAITYTVLMTPSILLPLIGLALLSLLPIAYRQYQKRKR